MSLVFPEVAEIALISFNFTRKELKLSLIIKFYTLFKLLESFCI